MSETAPYQQYGINDIRIYNRDTGYSIAHYRILGDATPEFTAEMEKLKGGSSLVPWASAVKEFNTSLKMTVREFHPDGTALLLGGTTTDIAAAATGDILYEDNVYGSSIYGVATGVLTITVTSGEDAELKEGWYLVKAASSTTVNVYAMNDASFSEGTDGSYQDDDGLINASPLTITQSTDTDISDWGITLTGGGGTIGMTVGDTARFYVSAPSNGGWHTTFGAKGSTFSDCGVIITSSLDDTRLSILHLYNCKVAGMSIPFMEKGYANYDITVEPSYDAVQDAYGIYTIKT